MYRSACGLLRQTSTLQLRNLPSNLVQKRGALTPRLGGGRSSVSGIVATVFGPTGFLGRYVTDKLGRIGSQVVVAYRGDEESYRHLKLMGDLGMIIPMKVNVRDRKSLEEAIARSNVVINLIGSDFETMHWKFKDVHVDAARSIAQVSKDMGIDRLIHVSALAVGQDTISDWAKSKAEGEAAVVDAFPGATILRPATMFGSEDRFLNRIATNAKLLPVQPIVNDGPNLVQPVYVGDVAAAVFQAVIQPSTAGQTFELGGPKVYTLGELYDYVFEQTRTRPNAVSLPPAIANILGYFGEQMPTVFTPIITRDMVKQSLSDVVVSPSALTFSDLGIFDNTSLEIFAVEYLRRYRKGGPFADIAPQEAQ